LLLEVTDVRGRAVRRIPLGERPAGEGSFVFDGRDDAGAPLPAGVYLATLETPGARVSRKFVRLP
jgi:flagellar basal-body rod modification protein FlgD